LRIKAEELLGGHHLQRLLVRLGAAKRPIGGERVVGLADGEDSPCEPDLRQRLSGGSDQIEMALVRGERPLQRRGMHFTVAPDGESGAASSDACPPGPAPRGSLPRAESALPRPAAAGWCDRRRTPRARTRLQAAPTDPPRDRRRVRPRWS